MEFNGRGEGKGEKGKEKREQKKSLIPYAFSLLPMFLLVTILCIFSNNARAADYTQDLNDFINLEVKPWVNSDIVIDTLNKQNENNANISESNLRVMDNTWRSQLRKINQPMISPILNNDLSRFLQKTMDAAQGVYTQITIIDNKGLNAAQTVISSNYWNTGKLFWENTFGKKSYAPYISDIYYSDETNKFQVEVSFMIIENDQPIGVVATGIDVEQLEDWKKRRK